METLKCPNCKADVGPTGKCEYCGTRVEIKIAVNNIQQDSISSFPIALEQVQEEIRRLKLFPKPSILENIFKIILSVLTFGIYPIIRKRIGKKNSFDWIEADISARLKRIKTFHSGNSEVDRIVHEIEEELKLLIKERNSTIRKTNIGCLITFLVFLIIVSKLVSSCDSQEYTNETDEYTFSIEDIEKYITVKNFDSARNLAEKLDLDKKKDYLRKIQLAEVTDKLEKIQILYDNGKISDAKKNYQTIKWIPIDHPEYDYKEKEAIREFNKLMNSKKNILEIKN